MPLSEFIPLHAVPERCEREPGSESDNGRSLHFSRPRFLSQWPSTACSTKWHDNSFLRSHIYLILKYMPLKGAIAFPFGNCLSIAGHGSYVKEGDNTIVVVADRRGSRRKEFRKIH